MADAKPVKRTEGDDARSEVATITDKAVLTQFAEMATAIPASPENGAEAILSQILSAVRWEDLNAPWESSDISDIANRRLVLTHAERRPSDFGGGLGVFLVCHLTTLDGDKVPVKSSGSLSVVGQVAAAYFRDWMPMVVEWKVADRPTEDGYYPHHLLIHDVMGAGKGKLNGQ